MDLLEDTLKPGLILDRYELLTPIAKGGMAQVWAARLTGTRGFTKTVAIKTMLPNLSDDPLFEQMFLDEASLASKIRHPHAVEIMDLGESSGILYLVMEWIDGEPLSIMMRAAMKQGGVPLPIAVRIIMQSCAGLHAAHELKNDGGELVGLVHRDVSPQNILVTYDGVVKVVDFGVAKATGRVSEETAAGQIKGKVPYMSPEQARGGKIDRRTDLFALGILLYMMTTGKHPFRKDNDAQTLLAICSDKPVVPPKAVVEGFPSELQAVILKSLEKNPDNRYQTGNDMLKALDSLPAEIRASSEDEVASFVRGLLAERMEKRRSMISAALENADARAAGRLSMVGPPPSGLAAMDELSSGARAAFGSNTRLSAFGPVPSMPTGFHPVSVDAQGRPLIPGLPAPPPPASAPAGLNTTSKVMMIGAGFLAVGALIAIAGVRAGRAPGESPTGSPAALAPSAGAAAPALATATAPLATASPTTAVPTPIAPPPGATAADAGAATPDPTQTSTTKIGSKSTAPHRGQGRHRPAPSTAPAAAPAPAPAPAPKPKPKSSTFVSPVQDPGF